LTSYQTYVLRRLLDGEDRQTLDLYNLRRIGEAYTHLTGKPSPLRLTKKFPEDSLEIQLYIDQQRYPVWVSFYEFPSINSLPEGNVLYLSHHDDFVQHREERRVNSGAPIEDYVNDYDIFVTSQEVTYSTFSTLTQIRTSRPKLLLMGDRGLSGFFPLPLRHNSEWLKVIGYKGSGLISCFPSDPTFMKLFILERLDSFYCDSEEAKQLQKFVDVMTEDNSFEVVGGSDFQNNGEQSSTPGIMTIKSKSTTTDPWILIDPEKSFRDVLETSRYAGRRRSPEMIENTNLRHSLEKMVQNPTRREVFTKKDLQKKCEERNIPYTKRNTRIQLAQKILSTL
jgi:hypothetical protein